FLERFSERRGNDGSGSIRVVPEKQDVAGQYRRSPRGIGAQALDYRQGLNEGPILGNDPGLIAIGPANLSRELDGLSVGPRQQLHDECRPMTLNRLSTALENIHFATFDVDLNHAHVFEGITVERAHDDVEAQGSGRGPGRLAQTSTKM